MIKKKQVYASQNAQSKSMLSYYIKNCKPIYHKLYNIDNYKPLEYPNRLLNGTRTPEISFDIQFLLTLNSEKLS